MLEKMKRLPRGIVGVKAVGKVSKEDYDEVFEPIVDEARRAGRRIRCLYQIGSEFERFTAGAAWEDARIGLGAMDLFDGCAVVTDVGWIREGIHLTSFLMPCPVKVFRNPELADAAAWLRTLPESATIAFRLLRDSGVIVAEVSEALRVQDFNALARTADRWIDAHGELQGIVIHARSFPGWENLASVLRHVRFVRNHHRKVKRIAVAADGRLATVLPGIGEHFVKAEVKGFGFDELASAVAWARGRIARRAAPARSRGPRPAHAR